MTELFRKHRAKRANSKKGFTLIELIIVIAILAILMTVLGVVLGGQVGNARRSADQSSAATVRANAHTLLTKAESVGGTGTEHVTLSDNGTKATITPAGLEMLAAMSDGTTDIGGVTFKNTVAGLVCDTVTYKNVTYTFEGGTVSDGTE